MVLTLWMKGINLTQETSDVGPQTFDTEWNSLYAAGNQKFCLTCCHNSETHYILMLWGRFI
jgi:hypothetical protein